MAGVPGLEPGPKVLETSMLTIDTIPLNQVRSRECGVRNKLYLIPHSAFCIPQLFVFFVQTVAAAATAKFIKLKPVGRVLFIFCRNVVPLFALGALQNYVISRHIFITRWSSAASCRLQIFLTTDN